MEATVQIIEKPEGLNPKLPIMYFNAVICGIYQSSNRGIAWVWTSIMMYYLHPRKAEYRYDNNEKSLLRCSKYIKPTF